MSKMWYPVIDYSLCKECGACINLCRQGVYEKEVFKPKVINPDGCIQGCHGCGNLCPLSAIEYVGDTNDLKNIGCTCS
ncbi:MAG: 4Fe-4S ferredoxin [Firmicutes bacterium HGW-Firmicutes-1]|nr:MAG: 4Fe-4S ferredoxin [Firmicutes bacterium HGW-Firmicutes-1]